MGKQTYASTFECPHCEMHVDTRFKRATCPYCGSELQDSYEYYVSMREVYVSTRLVCSDKPLNREQLLALAVDAEELMCEYSYTMDHENTVIAPEPDE